MQLTKEQIKEYRKHPEIIIEQILGIELYRYQKFMLKHFGYFNLKFKNGSYIRIPKRCLPRKGDKHGL